MAASPDLNGSASFALEDNVAEIRLSRPDRANAVTLDLVEDLYAIVGHLEPRDDVYAILLTHDGGTFCAGYDMDVIADGTDEEREALTGRFGPLLSWFRNVTVPVVAGSTGKTPAAGASLALTADIVVVGPDFRIWWPEINVGYFPHTMGPDFIHRVGVRRAAELVFLGGHARLGPEEARELGLVNRIVEADDVDGEVRDIGDILADHERDYGYLLDAYELFTHSKREYEATHDGGHALARWRSTHDKWFAGEQRLGGGDDPRGGGSG